MCGGRGSRLDLNSRLQEFENPIIEKPLIKLNQKHLIKYVIDTLQGCKNISKIYAATSPKTTKTKEYVKKSYPNKVTILETNGVGFSNDYKEILLHFTEELNDVIPKGQYNSNSFKILFLPADLPLISKKTINKIISLKLEIPCISIVVAKKLITKYGFLPSSFTTSIDNEEYCYSGISVVDLFQLWDNTKENLLASYLMEESRIINDPMLAFNINTNTDLATTEEFLNNKC